MRRSIEEQAEYMLEKMTVDMSIDFWQTKECAIAACDICIDAAQDSLDNDLRDLVASIEASPLLAPAIDRDSPITTATEQATPFRLALKP